MKLMLFLTKIKNLKEKKLLPFFEGRKIFSIRKEVKKYLSENHITALIEITTTNEFFYLLPVLEKLKIEGAFFVFTGNEKILPPLREILNKNDILRNSPSIHFLWTDYLDIPFYINATLCYDIHVPKSTKTVINFPHTIVSKTRHDVFSPAVEKITDTLITGEVYKNDILRYFKDFNIQKLPVLHEIGCPRSDAFFTPLEKNKKEMLKEMGLDSSLPVVLYTPTWNPKTSIFTWREDILTIPERHKVNLIVKVHPGAYLDPNHKKGSGGIDWKKFFEAEELKKRRIYNAMNTDSVDFTKICDVAITDISTMWVEYHFLRKPIIFLDIPEFFEDREMNTLGDFRNTFGYLVKNASELDSTIQAMLQKELEPRKVDPLLDNMLLYNKGKATHEAVKKIKELFVNYTNKNEKK